MSTESRIYWGVGILSVAILSSTLFFPADRPQRTDLPWHIEHPTADSVSVFGLTLGVSTPAQAEQRFGEPALPSLFRSPSGELSAEVFFEQVNLAGLRSRVVLTVDLADADLQGMFERGLRMAGTGSGKKVTLAADDVTRLLNTPISSLTYLPGVQIDESLLLKRFGKPAQIIREKKSGAQHWLYPRNGLDITFGGTEKPLLQYVAPGEFARLVRPLLASGEVVTP